MCLGADQLTLSHKGYGMPLGKICPSSLGPLDDCQSAGRDAFSEYGRPDQSLLHRDESSEVSLVGETCSQTLGHRNVDMILDGGQIPRTEGG